MQAWDVVRHELPESERCCAHDGHALAETGVETSEQLDVIPEQGRVVQHQRVKYACPCYDLGIKVTPAPACIIPRGLLTESAMAWIIATGASSLKACREAVSCPLLSENEGLHRRCYPTFHCLVPPSI